LRATKTSTGQVRPSAPYLGVDVRAGKSYGGIRGVATKRHARTRALRLRSARLLHLRRHGGRKAATVFAVGVKTTATCASAVTGVAPRLRKQLRGEALMFLQPYGRGGSASLVLATHKDPVADDCLAPAVRYHQEAWEALSNPLGAAAAGRLPLSALHAAWRRVAQPPPRGWHNAKALSERPGWPSRRSAGSGRRPSRSATSTRRSSNSSSAAPLWSG
jgi:hypothetical protein